jgi:probable phosphoglycerate mutase
MGNAAVCKVIYKDGKFTLESFGDMSYVEKGKMMSKGD